VGWMTYFQPMRLEYFQRQYNGMIAVALFAIAAMFLKNRLIQIAQWDKHSDTVTPVMLMD